MRRQRQHVGFGAARRENDVLSLRADQRRDTFACVFNDFARRPALAVNRGWIAREFHRQRHGRTRFIAQRRRGIPVEVSPRTHHFTQSSGGLVGPSEAT